MMRSAFLSRFVSNRRAVAAAFVLGAIVITALIGPIMYPTDSFAIVGRPFEPPFSRLLLGTDMLGRDVLAGIIHGARVTLQIATISTVLTVVLGTVVGLIAGYYGGWIDTVIMRLTEFFQTVPSFIFALVLIAIFKPSLTTMICALIVISWPPVARLVRGETLSLRRREYVLGCESIGMGGPRIIFTQVLPNCLSPIIVAASLMIATAILFESGLSFLGLGDANLMSWGYMIGAGRTALRVAWWLSAFPGVAILLTVLAINLLGEGLEDAFNSSLTQR